MPATAHATIILDALSASPGAALHFESADAVLLCNRQGETLNRWCITDEETRAALAPHAERAVPAHAAITTTDTGPIIVMAYRTGYVCQGKYDTWHRTRDGAFREAKKRPGAVVYRVLSPGEWLRVSPRTDCLLQVPPGGCLRVGP